MAQTLLSLNEKINKQIKVEKLPRLSKINLLQAAVSLICALLAFTANYKMGAVFMLPILGFLMQINKKTAFLSMVIITAVDFLIDINLGISTAATLFPLGILIHRDNKKEVNLFIMILLALMSYCLNLVLEVTEFSPFAFLLIILFTSAAYFLYYNALQINEYMKREKDFLFKEEIFAAFALLINFGVPLAIMNFGIFNAGFIYILLSVMVMGAVANRVYTLSYSFLVYVLLLYVKMGLSGIEVLPFVGIISAVLPQKSTYLKTFCFYFLAPVLFYFKLINTDILPVMFSLLFTAALFYVSSFLILKKKLNKLVPKYEEAKYYQVYVENFREDISQRLLNFAELFNAFANKSAETNSDLMKLDEAIDEVIEKHCKGCLKKELCLNMNHIKTYNYISQILKEGEAVLTPEKKRFLDLFGMYCLNAYDIINSGIELNQEYAFNKKNNSTTAVFQSQLYGLSQILQDFAIEVNSDFENETIKVEKLRDKLLKSGMDIVYIKVNSIRKKNIEIDIGVRDYKEEDVKLISRLVEETAKETVDIVSLKNSRGVAKLKLISKRIFELEFGSSYIGKDGARISGDNFLKCDMHNGNTVIALSDGMGNGYAAHIESKSTLELLNKMLQTGVDDHTAVSIINTLISLKEYNERFSTLDYVTVNNSQGSADFYKIGSAPSFIIRGNKVIRINNDNLPVGISKSIDKVTFDLIDNDIIVIVSDGVVERFNNINQFEKIIVEMFRTNSIQMAHDIIRLAITEAGGSIADDMTAIVLKVNSKKLSAIA